MDKQQLSERDTYTPMGAPQAHGNCDSGSKQSRAAGTVVQNSKTSDNNLDEELTPRVQGEQVQVDKSTLPAVYVLSINGYWFNSIVATENLVLS
jgi:hypothetical protein